MEKKRSAPTGEV